MESQIKKNSSNKKNSDIEFVLIYVFANDGVNYLNLKTTYEHFQTYNVKITEFTSEVYEKLFYPTIFEDEEDEYGDSVTTKEWEADFDVTDHSNMMIWTQEDHKCMVFAICDIPR